MKIKVGKEISDIPKTNSNELELKSNGSVDYSSQKKINTGEKPLMDLHRRRHREYLDYGWNTNKIAGEKKEKYYPTLSEALDMIQ